MIVDLIELGSMVTDTATGIKGMLTHYRMEMNNQYWYAFQPSSLHPDTGLPVNSTWIVESRIKGGTDIIGIELPTDIIGSEVEDLATGFKGTVISMILHLNGCIHVDIQPKGVNSKTGAAMEIENLDIRRLKGKKIPKLTKEELRSSRQKDPSPEERVSSFMDRFK